MLTAFPDWADDIEGEGESLLALRRAIHREPELGLDTPLTRAKLLAALDGLPLDIRLSERCSGFVAILDGASVGRTVLLRGDMDALPVREATGLDFASKIDGCMHACGHDSHSAMLATAARILCARRVSLSGRVLFMFQPGEEGHRGAKVMLDEGLLGDPLPDAAFAMHVWPTLPHGQVACRAGAMMASTDALHARIIGRGGHAAMPHDTLDPVPVAAEVVLALQTEIARRNPPTDQIVLSITCIAAGTAHNVLPDEVELMGTLRTPSPGARERGRAAFKRVCTHVAAAHGCTAEVDIHEGYPATVNDPRAVELLRAIAGDSFAEPPVANMAGEDFSFVLEQVPGALAFLGVSKAGCDPSDRVPLHHPTTMIDEAVLPIGVALHCAFATRFMEHGWR